jgi:hypothetical protein
MRLARGARGQSPYCTHVSTAKFLKWPLLFRLSYAHSRALPPLVRHPQRLAWCTLAKPAGLASAAAARTESLLYTRKYSKVPQVAAVVPAFVCRLGVAPRNGRAHSRALPPLVRHPQRLAWCTLAKPAGLASAAAARARPAQELRPARMERSWLARRRQLDPYVELKAGCPLCKFRRASASSAGSSPPEISLVHTREACRSGQRSRSSRKA